mgnify:CR=1 FL=1
MIVLNGFCFCFLYRFFSRRSIKVSTPMGRESMMAGNILENDDDMEVISAADADGAAAKIGDGYGAPRSQPIQTLQQP